MEKRIIISAHNFDGIKKLKTLRGIGWDVIPAKNIATTIENSKQPEGLTKRQWEMFTIIFVDAGYVSEKKIRGTIENFMLETFLRNGVHIIPIIDNKDYDQVIFEIERYEEVSIETREFLIEKFFKSLPGNNLGNWIEQKRTHKQEHFLVL